MINQTNPAIAQMTQELLEYRKNSSQKVADLEKIQQDKEEVAMQNMQI